MLFSFFFPCDSGNKSCEIQVECNLYHSSILQKERKRMCHTCFCCSQHLLDAQRTVSPSLTVCTSLRPALLLTEQRTKKHMSKVEGCAGLLLLFSAFVSHPTIHSQPAMMAQVHAVQHHHNRHHKKVQTS